MLCISRNTVVSSCSAIKFIQDLWQIMQLFMIKTIIFKHMHLALFAYPIYWRKTRKYQRNLHLAIRLILGNYWQKKLVFQHGKHFIELQLAYFIDIFEDNGKIVCHRFVTDSVNVKENRPLATKKHKKILIYIDLAQPYQKTMDIFTWSNNTQNFVKGYWFARNYWEAQWLGKVKAVAGGVLKKRCSGDMQQIYRKAPMPKCDLQSNFTEIALRHEFSPVNLLHIFRTPFPRNTSGWMYLEKNRTNATSNFRDILWRVELK